MLKICTVCIDSERGAKTYMDPKDDVLLVAGNMFCMPLQKKNRLEEIMKSVNRIAILALSIFPLESSPYQVWLLSILQSLDNVYLLTNTLDIWQVCAGTQSRWLEPEFLNSHPPRTGEFKTFEEKREEQLQKLKACMMEDHKGDEARKLPEVEFMLLCSARHPNWRLTLRDL